MVWEWMVGMFFGKWVCENGLVLVNNVGSLIIVGELWF